MEKVQLVGKHPEELKQWVLEQGLPAYTVRQLLDWMYRKRVFRFEEMTNLAKATRTLLSERAEAFHEAPAHAEKSADGTVKYLFRTLDGSFIESVYIPEPDRGTLCVSSQAGCKMGCAFCMTGRMGFKSNLTAFEILNQIFSIPETGDLTNIVFMGMGEPMDNLDEVLRALDCLTASWGLGWSPKRITVSTIGVLPGLNRFLQESHCHLAISLHTALPDQRAAWMPSQKAWPLSDSIELLRTVDFSGQRRLSFEYIVFCGLNDDKAHADHLLRLLDGLECRVNLIRFHTIPDTPFKRPDETTLQYFADYLNKKGLKTTIRKSRGEDIKAACGLLSTSGM
ncbi:MAG: 23S rRNA (adenine(2503)-C(2))-methyltransferase RlmN [Bacteroidota bacterium]|nr:23S rRNA (adenine(2503)-C(2))-methyltransferase RlmN [Bacteroidota bacterium]